VTKEETQEAVTPVSESPEGESIDRRRFLELSRKYAIVAPPAVGLLIAATEAKAHCQAGTGGIHEASPSCNPNHA
jgi:hypothetical protein